MDAMIITTTTLIFLNSLIFTTVTSSSRSNFTLYGTAHINQTAITLTPHLNTCTSTTAINPPYPNTGRIFYKSPIRFLDSSFRSTLSFSTHFSFTITPPPPRCPSGEGIAFLITSDTNSLPYSVGSIGLPQSLEQNSLDSSFLAVEFDTNFDQGLGDINDNHVGIDLDSVFSLASVDLMSIGIDLKKGKMMNSWIEYNNSQKAIRVWVGLSSVKPDSPVLAAPVDLSRRFHGFMFVGFSASNGDGASSHVITHWEFKTFESGFESSESESGSVYPNMEVEEVGSENCMICFPDIRKPEPETGPGGSDSSSLRNNHHRGFNLATALLVSNLILFILIVISVGLYLYLIKKQSSGQTRPEQTLIRTFMGKTNTNMNVMPRRFKYSEIRSATRGFNRNQIVGEGVSATVYKTDWNMAVNVAVKRFKSASFGSQIATEFATMAGSLQHKNLMKLKGWCCERNELILVYDYMPNGSLDKILRSQTITGEKLSFETRLNVLIGVSSALVYLHEECDRLIIHRNVKSSNVLLDYNFVPKLGDFGIGESARDVTVPARAMGYLAPEYVYSRVPTVKTDVYSFGVVVLEVATGRAAVEDDGVVVTDWVWDLWEEKRLVTAADRNLVGRFNRIDMEIMLMVGLVCVHPNYQMRPTMKEVLKMLRGEVVPELPDVKPTVVIQSVVSPEVVVKCGGGDDGVTTWGTPTSHLSKV